MRLLRLKPGHGEVVVAEGDVEVPEEERILVEAFRRELDMGMWAAVPTAAGGHREAEMVKSFEDVPRDAERVIFFPRAAGGAPGGAGSAPGGVGGTPGRAVATALGECAWRAAGGAPGQGR